MGGTKQTQEEEYEEANKARANGVEILRSKFDLTEKDNLTNNMLKLYLTNPKDYLKPEDDPFHFKTDEADITNYISDSLSIDQTQLSKAFNNVALDKLSES